MSQTLTPTPHETSAATVSEPSGLEAKGLRILFKDYTSFILLLANLTALFSVAGIPFLLILLPLQLWRMRVIRRTIEAGRVVPGVIVRRWFVGGEWLVWYAYQAGDRIYQVRNAVIAFTLPFKKGDAVMVCHDARKPSRAYLPALYSASGPSTSTGRRRGPAQRHPGAVPSSAVASPRTSP